jgi:hypothetical protein
VVLRDSTEPRQVRRKKDDRFEVVATLFSTTREKTKVFH